MSMRRDQGRPGLVWTTQILLGIFMAMVAFIAVGRILHPPPVANGTVILVSLVLWNGALLMLFGTLMYGLAVRRRWAWHGSIVFAAFLLFCLIVGWSIGNRNATTYASSAEQGGAMFATIFWSVLLAIYPFALFFSQKVRRFLSVDRTDVA
jgi:hypothetical protein